MKIWFHHVLFLLLTRTIHKLLLEGLFSSRVKKRFIIYSWVEFVHIGSGNRLPVICVLPNGIKTLRLWKRLQLKPKVIEFIPSGVIRFMTFFVERFSSYWHQGKVRNDDLMSLNVQYKIETLLSEVPLFSKWENLKKF